MAYTNDTKPSGSFSNDTKPSAGSYSSDGAPSFFLLKEDMKFLTTEAGLKLVYKLDLGASYSFDTKPS